YDADTGRVIGSKQLPGKNASHLQFSRNGRVLIGRMGDPLVAYHAWDVETGKEIGKHAPSNGYWVQYVALSPDGMTAALTHMGPTFRKLSLWDVGRGSEREFGTLNHFPAQFSGDGKRVFSTDGSRLFAWDVATGAALWSRERLSTKRSEVVP